MTASRLEPALAERAAAPPARRAAPGHLPALDGLRGLASLVVVIEHSFDAVAMPVPVRQALHHGLLAPFFHAQGAVQLFFVLSGFVLAGSLARSRERAPWALFLVRRWFRIHPPFVAGALFAWCAAFGYARVVQGSGLTEWLDQTTRVHAPLGAFLASLAFPGTAAGTLPVGWTLQIEMLYSFALPLLVLAARPGRGLPLLVGAAALLLLPERLSLGWYAIDFALGVLLWRERAPLARAVASRPAALQAILVGAGLALLAGPPLLGWSRPNAGVLVAGFDPRSIAVMAPGAAALVAAAAFAPAVAGLLAKPACLFLGRVSFSLYLLHGPILALLAPLVVSGPGAGVANGARLLAAVLAVSLPLSALAYRLVERPSIALGNRASRALAPRIGARYHESHAGETAA